MSLVGREPSSVWRRPVMALNAIAPYPQAGSLSGAKPIGRCSQKTTFVTRSGLRASESCGPVMRRMPAEILCCGAACRLLPRCAASMSSAKEVSHGRPQRNQCRHACLLERAGRPHLSGPPGAHGQHVDAGDGSLARLCRATRWRADIGALEPYVDGTSVRLPGAMWLISSASA
jgi:hypothetical protein